MIPSPDNLKLRVLGDPVLRQHAKPVARPTDPAVGRLANAMVSIMREKNGIGLAANQIGVAERIIVVEHADGELILINPTLSRRSLKKEEGEEGCLSIPGVFGMVKRSASVSYRGTAPAGQAVSGRAHGLFARVLQHEVDHLDGTLFIDRTKHITRGTL